jgi:hypothetical protein
MAYHIKHSNSPPIVKPLESDMCIRLIIVNGKSLMSDTVFMKESTFETTKYFDHSWSKNFLTKEDFIGKEFLLDQKHIPNKKSAPYTFFIMSFIKGSFSSWECSSKGTYETKTWIENNAS